MDKLSSAEIGKLERFSNTFDMRRDIHVFVRYVQEREVKRRHRDNALAKSDSLRLAKLISDPGAEEEVRETGDSGWVDFQDWLALKLGFIRYDTKGVYVGYSSSEPSFPDNFIELDDRKYERYLRAPIAQQERQLLDMLLNECTGSASEFFQRDVFSRLDRFSSWGSATAVVPMLDFPKSRSFLLEVLQSLEVGAWYSTASLVQHLKTAHPFFLIPEKVQFKEEYSRKRGRYGNFHESKDSWGHEIDISEKEPDAFERVEGRYVERFLEGIPLVLGYVDVAYAKREPKDLYPSINVLRGFKVNPRLQRALEGDIPEPAVTLQPSFEVLVESEFYPSRVLSELGPLTDLVSEGAVTLLKLRKEKVAARKAEDPSTDAADLLLQLTGRPLPQNVERELQSWAEHSEKFTLYRGFSLFEGDEDLPIADPFTVERLSPGVRLVHSPGKLFGELEKAELAPAMVKHTDRALRRLPRHTRTAFQTDEPRKKPAPEKKTKATLKRQTSITLHFPNRELHDTFRKALLDRRCVIESDDGNRTVTFPRRHEPEMKAVLASLKSRYQIRIEDID